MTSMANAEKRNQLRGFIARLLGSADARAIDLALASVDLAMGCRVPLMLTAAEDPVPIARSLHRRALGPERPFIACDPRRRDAAASVRSSASSPSGVRALAAARGGTLCISERRQPRDLGATTEQLRNTDDVMLIICTSATYEPSPLRVLPAPIRVPAVVTRTGDVPSIIDEYAHDAIVELGVDGTTITEADRAWVQEHATTHGEIEKTALRLVAIRATRSLPEAADRLGMAEVSLVRWLRPRTPTPFARSVDHVRRHGRGAA